MKNLNVCTNGCTMITPMSPFRAASFEKIQQTYSHLWWDLKKTFCSIFEKLPCSVDKYEVVTALRYDPTSCDDRSKALLGIQ